MASFTIDFLTSDRCGKSGSMTSPLFVKVESSPDLVSPVSSERDSSPTQPNINIDGTLHALQIQANKIKSNSKEKGANSGGKVKHSFIALISEAILNHPSRRLLLGEIYRYISDKYPQFNKEDKTWKNSIRHNLSLNECFVKVGRCERGHYWSIHPAVVGEFSRGDFTRRLARRRVRRNLAEESELERSLSYSPGVPSSSPGYQSYKSVSRRTKHVSHSPYPLTPASRDSEPDLTCSRASPGSAGGSSPVSPHSSCAGSPITSPNSSPETWPSVSRLPSWSAGAVSSTSPALCSPPSRDFYNMTSQSAMMTSPLTPTYPNLSSSDYLRSAVYMQHYQAMLQLAHGLPLYTLPW